MGVWEGGWGLTGCCRAAQPQLGALANLIKRLNPSPLPRLPPSEPQGQGDPPGAFFIGGFEGQLMMMYILGRVGRNVEGAFSCAARFAERGGPCAAQTLVLLVLLILRPAPSKITNLAALAAPLVLVCKPHPAKPPPRCSPTLQKPSSNCCFI